MNKVQLAKATPLQLDWLVADLQRVQVDHLKTSDGLMNCLCFKSVAEAQGWHDSQYRPSRSWAQGGPIIDQEGINVCIQNDDPGRKINPDYRWYAQLDRRVHTAYGPTPLIAAMRCYVASKRSDTVDVPEEL